MASSTSKAFAIVRYTSGSDTEANLADGEAIGMDYGLGETSEIGVTGFNIGVPQRPTDVPNIGERSTSKPDTSIVGVPINIEFTVNEKIQDNPKPIAKLLKFSLEAQTVRGTFTRGRFGLRNDNMNSLPTIVPESGAGIKFEDVIIDDQLEWSDHQTGTIKLYYIGDYTTFLALLSAIISA